MGDLENFRIRLIDDFKRIMSEKNETGKSDIQWIKGREVKTMLNICASSLQNLRINGKLHPTKVQGTWYYDRSEVIALFKKGGGK